MPDPMENYYDLDVTPEIKKENEDWVERLIKERDDRAIDASRYLTFVRLRTKNIARCNDVFHPFEEWDGRDWAVALTGEVGEMCNLLKKMRRGEDIPIQELAKEMADIMIYLDLLAASFEIDLAKEVILKFNEVSNKRGSNIKL